MTRPWLRNARYKPVRIQAYWVQVIRSCTGSESESQISVLIDRPSHQATFIMDSVVMRSPMRFFSAILAQQRSKYASTSTPAA